MGLPVSSSVNERGMVDLTDLEEEVGRGNEDSEEEDENFAPIRFQEGDFANWILGSNYAFGSRRSWVGVGAPGGRHGGM